MTRRQRLEVRSGDHDHDRASPFALCALVRARTCKIYTRTIAGAVCPNKQGGVCRSVGVGQSSHDPSGLWEHAARPTRPPVSPVRLYPILSPLKKNVRFWSLLIAFIPPPQDGKPLVSIASAVKEKRKETEESTSRPRPLDQKD